MKTRFNCLRFLSLLLLIFLFAYTQAFSGEQRRTMTPDTIVIIHLNDTHSHLLPFGPKTAQYVSKIGGMARIATLIKRTRAEDKNVLLIVAGDLMVGDLMWDRFFGVPEFKMLHELGCDEFTLGNHEFEIGPEVLKSTLKAAGLPAPDFAILSANIDMSKDPGLDSLVSPYVIKQVGNLKVGIFGLTTQETNAFQHPSPDSVIGFLGPAKACVDSLRPKVDLLIAATHLGVSVDSILAESVAGIDLIVGGHSHTKIPQPIPVTNPEGKTTYIVQAQSKYRYLGKMKAYVDQDGLHILSYALLPANPSVPDDPVIGAEIQALKDTIQNDPKYGPYYTKIIAHADTFMGRQPGYGYKDTPIGNLITDAYREKTGTDIALDVYGYISQVLWEGPLTGMDLFQTAYYGYNPKTGYGFNLMTYDLKGFQLKMGLEFVAGQMETNQDLGVEVSGLKFKYDPSKPPMSKVTEITVDGEPYSIVKTYTLTSNYGFYSFLYIAGLSPSNPVDTGIPEYFAIRDFAEAHSPLHYKVEGRIENVLETNVHENASIKPVASFKLFQNYPNPFRIQNQKAQETKISYQLTKREEVSLKIYNVLGEELKKLVKGSKNAGYYTVTWDGKDDLGRLMPNGIYFYKLKIANQQKTRKLILMR
ncbi:MAG TPA: T9SS type A sorting domain-containing protein [Bacteroidetes bacterium]|nr:T9SS type A sorting domain-containing protein [Bacteroidota bacterium]